MKCEIKLAKISEKETIKNLLQPYLTELSVFPDEDPDYKDRNGTYLYPYLDAYWKEKERFPYLMYCEEQIAGFALVRVRVEDDGLWEIAEFYVLLEFRRRGLAMTCITEIFKKHPGEWKIMFNKHNQPGGALWQKVAKRFSKGDILTEKDASHDYLRFVV